MTKEGIVQQLEVKLLTVFTLKPHKIEVRYFGLGYDEFGLPTPYEVTKEEFLKGRSEGFEGYITREIHAVDSSASGR